MPTVPLPERPNLNQLRKQAKDLRRAAGAGASLSDAQRALARQYGFAGWTRLRRQVEAITSRSWVYVEHSGEQALADRFLRSACLNYADDAPSRWREAARLREQHPELPSTGVAVAAVCGDAIWLRRHLDSGAAASEPTGPYGWSPLMYLVYARLDVAPDATLAAARILLEAGADPNDGRCFQGLPTPFTLLTGVWGGGEADQPPHPHAAQLGQLLLSAGADPNDGQCLYNRMFGDSDDFLDVLLNFGLGRGDGGPWRRLLPDLLDSPADLVRKLLEWALTHDQRQRVALLASRGVDVTGPLIGKSTPLEIALRNGHCELAELLRSIGARPPQLDPVEKFISAALAGDADAVAVTAPQIVAAAQKSRPALVVWATAQGRPEAIKLLANKGFDVNAFGRSDLPAEEPWQTALHAAVELGREDLIRLLLELGAEKSLRDSRFDGTPLDWAIHFGRPELYELLDQRS